MRLASQGNPSPLRVLGHVTAVGHCKVHPLESVVVPGLHRGATAACTPSTWRSTQTACLAGQWTPRACPHSTLHRELLHAALVVSPRTPTGASSSVQLLMVSKQFV